MKDEQDARETSENKESLPLHHEMTRLVKNPFINWINSPQGVQGFHHTLQKPVTLDHHLWNILEHLDRLEPLQDCLERLTKQDTFSQTPIEHLHEDIEELHKLGVLSTFSKDDKGKPDLKHSDFDPVELTVTIPTADRADMCLRCIDSLDHYIKKHNQPCRLVIADDSRSEQQRQALLSGLKQHSAGWLGSIEYIGTDQAKQTAKSLSQALDVDLSILESLVLNPRAAKRATGANRNRLLLASAGQKFITCDDDTLWNFEQLGDLKGVHVVDRGDPTKISLHRDVEAALSVQHPYEQDVCKDMCSLLGRQPEDMAKQADHLAFGRLRPDVLRAFFAPNTGAGIVSCGLTGDSACPTNAPLALAAHPQLLDSEEGYAMGIATRGFRRASESITFTRTPFLMLPCAGMDARKLLPPFVPVDRNQDGLFAMMYASLYPRDLIAHLPISIQHVPSPPRESNTWNPRQELASTSFTQVLKHCIGLLPASLLCSTPQARLMECGQQLQRLALNPPDKLLATIEAMLKTTRMQSLESLYWTRQRWGNQAPKAWLKSMEEAAQALEDFLQIGLTGWTDLTGHKHTWSPGQKPSHQTLEVIVAEVECIADYGRSVMAWSKIWAFACEQKCLPDGWRPESLKF